MSIDLLETLANAGWKVNDLSDTQVIYVGQLRVRLDQVADSSIRSVIANGNFLERIAIFDNNLISLLRGRWHPDRFLSRATYGDRSRSGRS